jgi:uncharacterized protein YbjQ (UPF0145 family)/DNA-directed RNA polymerase subunit RPC12/RpoP
MIEAKCEQCGATFHIDNLYAGRKGQCQKCGGRVCIPTESTSLKLPQQSITTIDTNERRDDEDPLRETQITTTNSIDGWIITEYRGMVTSNVVAGTGVFSDIAASFSDFFGGRSNSYQRQLSSIQKDALESLRHSATQRGANWIIGVKLDFDEVSGQGKQMFMLSASGTAVHAVRDSSRTVRLEATSIVPGTAVREQLVVESLKDNIRKIESGAISISEPFMERLCERGIPESVPLCLQIINSSSFPMDVDSKRIQYLAKQALRIAPRQTVRDAIHGLLLQNPSDSLVNLYGSIGLLDLRWALEQIHSHVASHRRVGLHILSSCVARTYSPVDIPVLRALIRVIRESVPESCTQIEAKGLLTGKTIKKWRCERGHDNPIEQMRCIDCDIDRHGCPKEYSVQKALLVIEKTLEMLNATASTGEP